MTQELRQHLTDVPDRVKVVSLDDIEAEDWTLNTSRYVMPPAGEDIPSLPEAAAAFKQAVAEARAAEERLRDVLTDGGWLASDARRRARGEALPEEDAVQVPAASGSGPLRPGLRIRQGVLLRLECAT